MESLAAPAVSSAMLPPLVTDELLPVVEEAQDVDLGQALLAAREAVLFPPHPWAVDDDCVQPEPEGHELFVVAGLLRRPAQLARLLLLLGQSPFWCIIWHSLYSSELLGRIEAELLLLVEDQ